MPRYIEFNIEDGEVSAQAVLWDERAPRTCAVVWDMLPVSGYLHHGIYSGPEIAMLLPRYVEVEPENATSAVLPWEIGFVSLRAQDYIDVPEDFSELCFFYDRGARPSMLDGPVKVNLFAQFVRGREALFTLCHRMRREGQKRITVQQVGDTHDSHVVIP
jgi:hypothetical protein